MNHNARQMTNRQEKETLIYMATRLNHIATILEDPGMQRHIATKAYQGNMDTLAPRE